MIGTPASLLIAALIALIAAVNWGRPGPRAWTLALVVGVVIVVGVAETRRAPRIFPLADIAVLEMYVRNALTGSLLVGPYSRFGWHHPGPLYFYLIAPLYPAAGSQAIAMAAGAAMLFALALVTLAWAGMRSLGSVLTAALLGSVALFVWRMPDLVTSPWNPHVVVVPTVALLVTCGILASGDWAMSAVTIVLASFIAQTDVALVPVVAAGVGTAYAAAAVVTARTGNTRGLRAYAVASVAALALCWCLPIVEELTYSPGNATLLLRFFLDGGRSGQPFSKALEAWAAMLAMPAQSTVALATGATFVAQAPARALAVAVAELAGVGLVALWGARSGRRPLAWLGGVAFAASIVGLWSAMHIEERIMDHEVFWLTAIGLLNLALVAGAAALFLLSRLERAAVFLRVAAPAVQASLIALSVAVCFAQLERARAGHLPVTMSLPPVERLASAVGDYVNARRETTPFVRIGEEGWGVTAGVLLELNRRGVPFTIEESWMPMFPHAFASNGRETLELSFSNAAAHAAFAARPQNELVGSYGDLYVDAVPRAPGGN